MSRRRQLEKKMRKGLLPRPAAEGLDAEDARERGGAVRSCCPCRVGWEAYEERRDDVERLCKDDDPTVRFNALHVREDVVLMEALASAHEGRREAARRRGDREATKAESRVRAARRRAKSRA